MPITPFIGVRISWLMLARKPSLAAEPARAAASLRTSSAPWRRSACAWRRSRPSASRMQAPTAATPRPSRSASARTPS